ncbi:MerR family transcriptional regulator [Tolypothrix sp. FACHB-123]|uniref:MerR family transcriptional regulator n=1 Tax=Tolypothrix sp. FACHB-123 TaxID=2692868 RepID=UPI00168241EC|nr:MerR family transcriptional regulator [Tolypothrix sp. FACHB-123]MBD2357029.1 MerR family transcriptional regulator [Tolypothrix sp. FACHB-123]
MVSGLTRQETISITGVSSSRLSYLDSSKLVSPNKFGNPKHPKVIYSWEQILQIKIIDRLRERLSLQEIRKVLEFLEQREYTPSFFKCNLVFIGEQLYLIESWQDFGLKVLEASGKNKGQLVIHEIGAIGEVIAELQARKNEVLDFDKRIKGTPLESLSAV